MEINSTKSNLCEKSETDFIPILTKLKKILKVSLIPNAHVQHGTHSNYVVFTNEIQPITKCFPLLDGVKGKKEQ